jgi:hypothetical protein
MKGGLLARRHQQPNQMASRYRFAFLVALLCASQSSGFSKSKPLELKWSELGTMIVGQRVELMLADGTDIRGEAVAVREEALVMDVRKASGETVYQRGSATIPRGSIGLIKLDRRRGSWGRTMGTVVGVLSGLVIGGWAAAHTDSARAGIPVFLSVASGISVAGYYTGREIDRRVTLIRIVP